MTYKPIKQERIHDSLEPEIFYKFELVKVELYSRHATNLIQIHKIYIKDGYKFKLIKNEERSVNQKEK